jgi:membrane-bound serine protease (ClpP class)
VSKGVSEMKPVTARAIFLLSVALVIITCSLLSANNSFASSDKKVFVIPLEKEVEQGLREFLKRSFAEAEEANASHIILEINTPGGAVNAATDIAKLMRDTKIPMTAYINNQALSAGAYIALNADEIVMVSGSVMGAAAIIDQQGNTAGKKAESFWHAEMQSAAKLNDRNPIYALAMADEDVDLPDLGSERGALLTLNSDQAFEVGYAEKIVNNKAELLEYLNLSEAEIYESKVSLAEKFARFITNPIVVPILLSIGSLGLVLELYSPGFGIPGLMGASALLLFFYGHLVAGLAGLEAILLLIIGVILILLELFVPGGIMGLIGIVAIIISLFLSTDNIVNMSISIVIAFIVTIIASILLFKFVGLERGIFRHIILKDATNTEQGYVSNETKLELIGLEGTTITPLRPAGTVLMGKERMDVVSEGGYIGENKKVKIVTTAGSRVVVREIMTDHEK